MPAAASVEPVEPVEPVDTVSVASQRCSRPMVHRGVGIDLGGGRFLTAAHVVDGDLRTLTVDDVPAVVAALDPRLDLAVLALDIDHEAPSPPRPIGSSPADPIRPGPARVLTAGGPIDTEIVRAITLRVDDVTASVVHERPALELAFVADPGDSGAPVLDASGAIVGVVVLSDPPGRRSFAVRPPVSMLELPDVELRPGCAPR